MVEISLSGYKVDPDFLSGGKNVCIHACVGENGERAFSHDFSNVDNREMDRGSTIEIPRR